MAKSDRPYIQINQFFTGAQQLRAEFDQAFADPRQTQSKRFVWDYWYVKDQYRHMRTPAWEYFTTTLYRAFHERLVNWGRAYLGCHDISPPWLSYYVDGCRQEIHTDRPHGPWAFVYSLTDWQRRRFEGGETLLLTDEVLDYWRRLPSISSLEGNQILEKLVPEFNRLTVFDPRVPHGVAEVRGAQDPRESRLVVHGWFVNPRPFLTGGLSVAKARSTLNEFDHRMQQTTWLNEGYDGYLGLRFQIAKSGEVQSQTLLQSTVRSSQGAKVPRRELMSRMRPLLAQMTFPPAKSPSTLTLPILFVTESNSTPD